MQRYHSKEHKIFFFFLTISFGTIDNISTKFFSKASIKLIKICETLYWIADIFSIAHREAIISAFGNHDFYIYIYIYLYL